MVAAGHRPFGHQGTFFAPFKFSALATTCRRTFLLRDGAIMAGCHDQLVERLKDQRIAEGHDFWLRYAGRMLKNEFCMAD